jgi:hypothetical protein
MSDAQRSDQHLKLALIAGMILLAALSRLVPHPWNFSPLEAMALFAGAHIARRWVSMLVPLAALFVSDLFLGFYEGIWVTYLCFALIAFAGRWLRGAGAGKIAIFGLASATGFFIVSNFAVWALGTMYPHTATGLMSCYVSAIPYFHNQLAGVAFYSLVLFGGYALLQRARGKSSTQAV